jgi:hypothetical protein
MKLLFFTIIFLILFVTVSLAAKIEVIISEKINSEVDYVNYTISNNILKISSSFYNIGSVDYKARMRADIFDEMNLIFTAWSKEEPLRPGERKDFEIYSFVNTSGNYTTNLRVYYANEILDYENRSFELKNFSLTKDIFEIKDFRTYDDYVKFSIRSSQPLENVIVISSKYPVSWTFEQVKIEKLDANKRRSVSLPYQGVFSSIPITITILSEDGKYATSETFLLKKESGFWKYFNLLTDNLKDFLNIF